MVGLWVDVKGYLMVDRMVSTRAERLVVQKAQKLVVSMAAWMVQKMVESRVGLKAAHSVDYLDTRSVVQRVAL